MSQTLYNGPFVYQQDDQGRVFRGGVEVDPKTLRPLDEPEPPPKRAPASKKRKKLEYKKVSLLNGGTHSTDG